MNEEQRLLFKSVISYGALALKSALAANAGGVAMITYFGADMSGYVYVLLLLPMLLFMLGAFSAVVAIGTT